MEQTKKTSHMTAAMYNLLMLVCQILLPLIGTGLFIVAKREDRVTYDLVGYILIADLCLGLFLKFVNYKFNKNDLNFDGTITIEENENKKSFSLNLNGDPDELDKKQKVIFKITTVNK